MAVAGIAGGYLYQINVSLPFLMVALAYTLGLIVSFNLTEPKIDSEKYSWNVFVSQNKEGFAQLFSNNKTIWTTLLILIHCAFMVATENVVNDATVIELGYNSIGFGYFATILYLFGTLISIKSDWIISKLGNASTYITLLTIYSISLLLIPWSMIAVGTILLLVRYGVQTIFDNYQSVRINEIADSRYRATTLSTFNLLRNIPYVFCATGIGFLMNIYTAKTFSLYLDSYLWQHRHRVFS
jgi:hypothetical protein